jgi:Zn-dependent protease
MIRFSIFGIPVEVQPFFWVTLVLIGGALGADSASAILQTLLFVLAGFISILVHELGHALTARKFGAHSSIVLQAFGGLAQHSGVHLSRPQAFVVTAAGPLLQIGLGLAVWYALPHLTELKPHAGYFFVTLMSISFIWALLNLLPILPLDGGQMLHAILGQKRVKITLWTTIICAALIGGGYFMKTGSFILPVFMGLFAWQAFQALKQER